MEKNNRGVALAEVLVSIIVVSIIAGFMVLIFHRKLTVDHKTLLNYNLGEVIERNLEFFSVDPTGFCNEYGLVTNTEVNVYYNGDFSELIGVLDDTSEDKTKFYINYTIVKENNYYTLKVSAIVNDQEKVFFTNSLDEEVKYFERKVYVGA